jgi:hypothetical protein
VTDRTEPLHRQSARGLVAEPGVECWPADLCDSSDLDLRNASGDGLSSEVADRFGFALGAVDVVATSSGVDDELVADRVGFHDASVKHLTWVVDRRKVLYMTNRENPLDNSLRPVDMAPTLVGRTITHAEYTQDGSVALTLDDGARFFIEEYVRGGVVVYRDDDDER